MNIQPIKDDAGYKRALKEVGALFDAKPNTAKGEKLDILVTLIKAYEEKHDPIDFPDPVIALEYYMESRNLSWNDLESCIGSRGSVSEVLNRKHKLSLTMIRKLRDTFHIPADALI